MAYLNAKFEDGLFEACTLAFKAILLRDAIDPKVFASRMNRLTVHGLLSIRVESAFKPKEIVVDTDRLEDSRYRRKLIRELKAPRPSKWVYHNIHIDRDKLLADENYLADMVKVLAYKWTQALLPVESPVTALLLLKQDADSLTHCLDHMGPHQISAETVGSHRLRSFCEEALDKNETLNAHLDEIRRVGAEARRIFLAEMEVYNRKAVEDFNTRVGEILADANAACDDYMLNTHEKLAATAEHSRTVLEESGYPNNDPEREWREALARSDAKRKAENKLSWKGKSLIGLGVVGVTAILGFFLEVNGVTPFAALSGLFN